MSVDTPKIGDPEDDRGRQSTIHFKSIYRTLTAYIEASLLYLMARWELADLLINGPLPLTHLSQLLSVPERHLRKVLLGLAHYGYLEIDGDHAVLTDKGRFLLRDHQAHLRNLALLTHEQFIPAWRRLEDAVNSGTPGFDLAFGRSLFERDPTDEQHSGDLQLFMSAISRDLLPLLLNVVDFPAGSTIVDIGGGDGTMIVGLLEAFPESTGILYDREEVVLRAKAQWKNTPVANRLEIEGGDFFREIPEGGDHYLFSQILHDWDDAACGRILANCRRAMKPSSKILIITYLLGALPGRQNPAYISDLNMLALTGGRERSNSDYTELLESNGLSHLSTTPIGRGYFLLEAEIQ